MSSDIWAHLADTLKGYETSLPPSGPDYLISNINAPLPETVEFDEVNDPFLLYVNCLIAMPLNWSRTPMRPWNGPFEPNPNCKPGHLD